jgi:hypothetical protein
MDKAEIKTIIAEEFAEDFTGVKLLAEADVTSWQGAKKALNGAAKMVDALLTHLEDEEFSDEQTDAVRLYIRRAVEVCHSLRLKAEVNEQRALGRAQAFNIALKMSKAIAKAGTRTPDASDT